LDRLASRDVVARRLAAEELARSVEKQPLRPLALERMASLGMTETDTLVWQGLLNSVASDTREPATRLAYAAIGHASPEIRRRACEHLASSAEGNHVRVLIPALRDRNSSVVRAAIVALGLSGRPEAVEPLKEQLAGSNESLRVEVAVALARLGDPSGSLALERLAYSSDESVRRDAAKAMGQVADPTLVPSLVRLLDDRQTIRHQALESLPLVVGHDVAELSGGPSLSSAERIAIWKKWHASQPNLLGSRGSEPAAPR
jgi:HEAT repeat protein